MIEMLKLAKVLALGMTVFMQPVVGMAQVLEFGPGGVRIGPSRRVSGCEELRRACNNREELGEEGRGNCRRYRETCLRRPEVDCRELREACLDKEERGEEGGGNCRRYRELCRR